MNSKLFLVACQLGAVGVKYSMNFSLVHWQTTVFSAVISHELTLIVEGIRFFYISHELIPWSVRIEKPLRQTKQCSVIYLPCATTRTTRPTTNTTRSRSEAQWTVSKTPRVPISTVTENSVCPHTPSPAKLARQKGRTLLS